MIIPNSCNFFNNEISDGNSSIKVLRISNTSNFLNEHSSLGYTVIGFDCNHSSRKFSN